MPTQVFAPIPAEVEKAGKVILDCAYKVHSALGPGLLETVYEACLAYEIRNGGLAVATQPALPVVYREVRVDAGLRPDMIVDNCVIVELKAVEKMIPLYEAQLMTYLKLTGIRLGFLINFNFHTLSMASNASYDKTLTRSTPRNTKVKKLYHQGAQR